MTIRQDWRCMTPEEMEATRLATVEGMDRLRAAIARHLPADRFIVAVQSPSDGTDGYFRAIAATIDVSVLHVSDNRRVETYNHIYFVLNDEERAEIGRLVLLVALEAGFEVLYKPKASTRNTLCYRLWVQLKKED